MTAVLTANAVEQHEIDYPSLLSSLRAVEDAPLFTTDADFLFGAFLGGIPSEHRQHYTCNTCSQFVNTYGGLVTIGEDGKARSAIWQIDTSSSFNAAIAAMTAKAERANVTGVFYSDKKVWGTPTTGEWHHMSVVPPANLVFNSRVKTPGQASAEKLEDFRILNMSLAEYPLAAVQQAVLLLQSDSLYRSEKCLGVAEWLLDLHNKLASTKNTKIQKNLIWRAVATAPAGFCHVRSSMIGTLLDDIVAGLSYDAITRRFASKMNPLQYQRPQAAPTAGNIENAEKLVTELGISESLKRRFARLEDIHPIWTPRKKADAPAPNGVFSHLKPKQAETNKVTAIDLPVQTVTWVKFQRDVLPNAERIQFFVPSVRNHYAAFVTASDPSAPPIIQWDLPEDRNPVSWYVYQNGSLPSNWLLSPLGFVDATAICFQPSMLSGKFDHQGESAFILLDGAKDSMYRSCGLGLFPEILKSELREARATIEAFSRQGTLEGYESASACGIRLQKGVPWDCTLRVTTKLGALMYRLDRWE